jgi:hypothetical protein
MIVGRSGALVYQTKGYDNSTRVFDGHSNINGRMQLPGTYYYSRIISQAMKLSIKQVLSY